MGDRFRLQDQENLLDWIKEVIVIAKGRAKRYKWSDTQQPQTVSIVPTPRTKDIKEINNLSLAWSVEFDDMINEACLAYLQALEKPGLKNPAAYARVKARFAISNMVLKEGRSHGLVKRKDGTGGMTQARGIVWFRNKGRKGFAANAVKKTHCIRGHERTPENLRGNYGDNGMKSRCRVCEREQKRARYLKYKERKRAMESVVQGS